MSVPCEQFPRAVSGLVCGAVLSFAETHGGSAQALTFGLGASPERLRQWHAWFPWETYLALERRFGRAMAHLEEPYLALGKYVITHRWLGAASLALRALATPAQTYRLAPWLVPRFLLGGSRVELREPSDDLLLLEYHFDARMEPTAPFLEVIRGQLTMGPTFVGQPPAQVVIARHDRQMTRFEVRLPPWSRARRWGVLEGLRQQASSAGRRSRVLLDLGGELLRTNELLGEKLRELEETNQRLLQEAGERQRAVAAVRASEERYRALAEAAEEIIVVLDEELRIQYVNPWGAALTSVAPDSLSGRSLSEFLPRERFLAMRQMVGQVLRSGVPLRSEGSFGQGDAERVFEASWVPLQEGDGPVRTVLCVARDVTVRRHAEREKAHLDAQLLHTQKLESLGVLVGGVAHDFNNLLTVVRGNAELARQRLPSEHPARSLLGPVVQAASQGAELCRLMLAFAGKEPLRRRRVGLTSTLRGMESLLRASIPTTAELRLDLEENLPPLLGDRTQLRQLAMNLVVNGAEALGGATGLVTVRTGLLELGPANLESAVVYPPLPWSLRYLCLEVTDTGCGMDAETRSRAFDPFFTTKFPGRGLGLAAVLGIVRAHGGLLTLESAPGRGTRICVGLPETIGEEEVSPDEPFEEPLASSRGAAPSEALAVPAPLVSRGEPLSGLVLLVDDEREIRELGRAILEELGLEVLTAADGQEALHHFRQGGPRIVAAILDIAMPTMDGEALFRALRERAPDLPVLIISGHGAREVAARFEDLQPYAFLPKPYSITELQEVLLTLLPSRTGPVA